MIATIKGRLQTKLLTFLLVAPSATLFAFIEDCTAFYTMFALMIVIGLALEVLYGSFIDYEPGWLTILFAVIEFTLIFGIIKLFALDLRLSGTQATLGEGLRFYFITWALVQLFLIYLLPVLRTSWPEEGGEIY